MTVEEIRRLHEARPERLFTGPQVAVLLGEIDRLRRGDFTEEEFQNLCHNFTPNDARRFQQGCRDYQRKLFGDVIGKWPGDETDEQINEALKELS